MASPSPEAVVLIRGAVADWSPDDAAIAAALNAPALPNPDPAPTVPVPFTAKDLTSACSAATRPNLAPFLGFAGPMIVAQDAAHIAAALDALADVGAIGADDAAAMKAVLARTRPDPGWADQLGWAEATLGRPADVLDVAAARGA